MRSVLVDTSVWVAHFRHGNPSLVTLLASTLLTPGASLWTLDKRLASLAQRFGLCYGAHQH